MGGFTKKMTVNLEKKGGLNHRDDFSNRILIEATESGDLTNEDLTRRPSVLRKLEMDNWEKCSIFSNVGKRQSLPCHHMGMSENGVYPQ